MAEFRVTYESHGGVPQRDAQHMTVRVWRGGEPLGVWSTWLSGIDLALRTSRTLDDAFWRAVAIVLARVVEADFRSAGAPEESSIDAHYVPVAADLSRIESVAASQSAEPLVSGEEIATFEA